MKGWAPKSSVCPSKVETRKIKLFGRDILGFCWDIPVVPEKLEKRKSVFNLCPLFHTLDVKVVFSGVRFRGFEGWGFCHILLEERSLEFSVQGVVSGTVTLPGCKPIANSIACRTSSADQPFPTDQEPFSCSARCVCV